MFILVNHYHRIELKQFHRRTLCDDARYFFLFKKMKISPNGGLLFVTVSGIVFVMTILLRHF